MQIDALHVHLEQQYGERGKKYKCPVLRMVGEGNYCCLKVNAHINDFKKLVHQWRRGGTDLACRIEGTPLEN